MRPLERYYAWRQARRLRAEWDASHERLANARYVCPHQDYLCDKYGCPDDPAWKGDRP